MYKFQCSNCLKEFKQSCNYNRHLNRKNPCKRADKKESPRIAQNRRESLRIAENRQGIFEEKNDIENTPVKHTQCTRETKCKYCDQPFKNKRYLPKHYRSTCALIPENKRIFYIEKYKNNKKHINNRNQIKIFENNTNIKNINSNNTTNIQNIQNIQNNNNIIIKINPFGKEDISSLGKNDILRLINRAYKMIPDTMKAIHFDIPENRNMYIPNVNRPLVKIFNGEEWVYKSLDYVTQMVSDNIRDNMEDWTSKYANKLSPIKRRALNEFVNKCVEGKMETLFKEEFKMFLMTYSNELKDFLNTEVSNKLETMDFESLGIVE